MPTSKTFLFLLTLLLLLAPPFFSHSAQAAPASGPDWQNADCSELNRTLQDNETERAQKLVQNNANYWSYLPPIDLAAYNCLNQLDQALDQLQAISNLGLQVILDSMINNLLVNIIGQVCNAATATLNGAINMVYSQLNRFCIPLPNLSLHLGAPSFPTGPACNGTPLLHTTPLPAATASTPSLWTLWGKRPGQTSSVNP